MFVTSGYTYYLKIFGYIDKEGYYREIHIMEVRLIIDQ